jgi:hypothetical protein
LQHLGRRERTATGLGSGLIAGVILGIGVGLLLTAKEGAVFRRALGRARRLKHDSTAMRRRVGHRASELAEQGADLAKRVRTATSEGVRAARKRLATPREPSREGLAGVERLEEPS